MTLISQTTATNQRDLFIVWGALQLILSLVGEREKFTQNIYNRKKSESVRRSLKLKIDKWLGIGTSHLNHHPDDSRHGYRFSQDRPTEESLIGKDIDIFG